MTDTLEKIEAKRGALVFQTAPRLGNIKITSFIAVHIVGDALNGLPSPYIDEFFHPFSVRFVEMPCCGRKGGLTRDVFFDRSGLMWAKQDIPCPCGKEGHYVVKYG